MAQMQFDDFVKQGKAQYDELAKKEAKLKEEMANLKKQMATLKPMLIEAGLLEKQTRKRPLKVKAPTE